jgi:hypothetical protein
MLNRTRSRLTYANVMATIALFVALGGTGYAAAKINGKQIKKGTIAGEKLKRNTLGGGQVNESKLGKVPRAARADSATSADTAASAAAATTAANASNLGGVAASDYRRYSDAIPSGTNVRGAWGLFGENLAMGQVTAVTVQFPVPAPVGLADADVNFAPSASAQDDDPACLGSVGNPTAPRGRVCIYIGDNTATNVGGSLRANATSSPVADASFGFAVAGQAAIAGGLSVQGSWAYTAP